MITAQVEPYQSCLPELNAIYPAHWEELALNKDKVPLNPMQEVYDALDAAGELMLVTLRQSGELVGYFLGFVKPSLHYRDCLTLTMDIYYTVASVRGGTAGLRLFRAVEREAKRRGVQRMFLGSKLHKDSSRLFTALGFEPVETYHSKWIGN
jgi:L-amino acid N-acyltransferase YncA